MTNDPWVPYPMAPECLQCSELMTSRPYIRQDIYGKPVVLGEEWYCEDCELVEGDYVKEN